MPRTLLQDKKAAERAGDSDDECAARASGPDAKELETRAIASQLAPLGLDIKPVPADGNCLFRVRAGGRSARARVCLPLA